MKLHLIIPAAAIAMAAASCSGGDGKGNASTVATIDVNDFKGQKAIASAATIDSMALEADFLTPEQGVTVLVGLSEIARNEEMKQSPDKRLEYMRKFLDTYDILSDRGDEFKQAIASAKASTGIDLPAIADRYRTVLNDEADGSAVETEDARVRPPHPCLPKLGKLPKSSQLKNRPRSLPPKHPNPPNRHKNKFVPR